MSVEVGVGDFSAKVELRKTPEGNRSTRMLQASRIRSPARRALSFNNDFDATRDRSDILPLPEASYTARPLTTIVEEERGYDSDPMDFIHEIPDLEAIPDDELGKSPKNIYFF